MTVIKEDLRITIWNYLQENKISVLDIAPAISYSERHLFYVLHERSRALSSALLQKINDYLGTDFKKETNGK